jgi:phytoene/squalene synthetase
MIEARGRDLDAAPFATFAEIDAYLNGTAGNLMRIAAAACGVALSDLALSAGARAWGYSGLLRAAGHWRAKGRSVLPQENSDPHAMVARAREAYAEARAERVPADAFPVVGYVALTPLYLRAVESGRSERSLFRRQLKLIAASARGRL